VSVPDPLVHPAKLPNDLPPDRLIWRANGDIPVATDPAKAGWRYLSFRGIRIRENEQVALGGGELETVAVIVGGGGLTARSGADSFDLPGRSSVWSGLPWALYLPPGQSAELTGQPRAGADAVELAIGQAPRSGRDGVAPAPVVVGPDDVKVEVRGAGHASRQVTHIIRPDFPADRLLCVEVYTPGGNWSGWPPHKHDIDDMPNEAVLEETYYYQVRRPEGWGIQRVYRTDGTRDALWAVRNGDLVAVPAGYHPFSAAPLYDAYYLNVLAGDRRTMANREDPDLTWVRDTFASTPIDPRVPMVTTPDSEPEPAPEEEPAWTSA
jgi:5-deoxy-glucuronate isomerase